MEPLLPVPAEMKNDAPPVSPQPGRQPRLRPNREAVAELIAITQSLSFTDDDENSEDTVETPPLSRLANAIIAAGIELGASDIHIEPDRRVARVRCRIDGVLMQMMVVPKSLHRPLLNSLKLMAEIPYWHPAPQTGVIRRNHENREYNLQVWTTSTSYGEYLTLHVVECRRFFGLAKLKVPPEIHAVMEDSVLDGGLFVISGPQDSGKTTMGYCWVNKLNDIERAVATVESVPSFCYGGLLQTYYKGKAAQEATPGIIRNLQKQKANVLYVDDVEDGATLDAVLNATEDGILSFASLTASSIPHAIKRLLFLGENQERLSASLSGILFQVLVGLICPDCREEVPFDSKAQASLEALFAPSREWSYSQTPPLPDLTVTYCGKGCETCHGTGIQGRTGIFGYVNFDDEARRLLQAGNVMGLKRTVALGSASYCMERGARAALWEGRVSLEELQAALRPVVAAARRVV